MSDVVMPRLSDSMEEGTILKWLKADGDEIARGDELAEIETDKATMTYEADTAGTLSIVAQEGQTLAIGEVIARIGAGGEAPAQEAPADEAPAEDVPAPEQPPTRQETPAEETPEEAPAEKAPAENAPAEETPAPTPVAAPPAQDDQESDHNGGRPKASPVARRIARERDIDLSVVQGTGPGGRIVKSDVESAQAAGDKPAAPVA
ncbi:MAG: E3 binding domain-containing protein, partial [Actinomycetota bacterium]|nr:E3 binding domain-containing protein [Actinomycetota bacterium]